MIQVVDNQGDVLAHVHVDVVRTGEKLRRLVHQVGGQDAVDQAVFIILIELIQPVRKQAEGRTCEDLSRLSSL